MLNKKKKEKEKKKGNQVIHMSIENINFKKYIKMVLATN